MPEFKERPKMDKPKGRSSSPLQPKQAAKLLRDKYVKQLEQRQEGAENETTYAADRAEGAGRHIADEAMSHRPQLRQRNRNAPKERQKPKGKEDPAQAKGPKQRPADRPKEKEPVRPKERETVKPKTPENTQRPRPANAPKARKAPAIKERTVEPPTPKQETGQAVPRMADRKKMVEEKARRSPGPRRELSAGSTETVATPKAKPSSGSSAPKVRPQGAGKLKERPRSIVKTRSSATAKKPDRRLKAKGPAARGAKKAARETMQKQMTRQMMAQAKRAAKATATAIKKAAEAAVRATVALISGLVGLLGGGVFLALLLLVAIVAAIASSPFGIFFAGGGSGGSGSSEPTVSVAEAVGQINMEYNTKLENLQAGDYDSIDLTGSAPDWADVLAVFGSRYAAVDEGVDVATLDADRVNKLTSTFWDMCSVTHTVQSIHHAGTTQADGTTSGGWTEHILHITITPKTADEMRSTYGFNDYQTEAMNEMLSDRPALASLAGSLDISNPDALAVLNNLPAGLSADRRNAVKTALQLVGKVTYFWGGKSYAIGWDSRWGQVTKVTAAGSPTTGTFRPYGLDCSGFADWVFYNASGGAYLLGNGGGAHSQHGYCTATTWDEAMPGDLVFYPEDEHVGIVCGRGESGGLLVIHCASSYNNVVITDVSGFTSVGRPLYYGE